MTFVNAIKKLEFRCRLAWCTDYCFAVYLCTVGVIINVHFRFAWVKKNRAAPCFSWMIATLINVLSECNEAKGLWMRFTAAENVITQTGSSTSSLESSGSHRLNLNTNNWKMNGICLYPCDRRHIINVIHCRQHMEIKEIISNNLSHQIRWNRCITNRIGFETGSRADGKSTLMVNTSQLLARKFMRCHNSPDRISCFIDEFVPCVRRLPRAIDKWRSKEDWVLSPGHGSIW